MKKLLLLLFSLFLLNSPSVFADDISDFEIEGMSIGDSLLDYMTEEEILEEIELNKGRFLFLKEPDKYVQINLIKDFSTYDEISFLIMNNASNKYITDKNEKYKILTIRGARKYIEDFNGCKQERDEIVEVLSRMFPNIQKIELVEKSPADSSGNSIMDNVFFKFNSGAQIDVYCSNYEETFRTKKNWFEGLSVSLIAAETHNWLRDYK